MEPKFVKIKVKVIEGKYLLHHYLRANVWDHPAGAIEEGETAIEAALRELLERTGYKVDSDDLIDSGIETQDGEDFIVFSVGMDKLVKVQEPQTEIEVRSL